MHITHNDHTTSYQTVAESLAEGFEWGPKPDDFESPEHMQRCIDTNELWEIQWYPDTPVGFCKVYGPTFEETLAFANKVADQ